MTLNHLRLFVSLLFLASYAAQAAGRVERGTLIFDNIPEAPEEMVEKLDAYLGARQATPLGWSPNGQLLIATRFADAEQLHLVEKPEGARRQITFLREPILAGESSPDPAHLGYAYLTGAGGSGNTQVFYQSAGDHGLGRRLTDGKSTNEAALWSNAGHDIAFSTNSRDAAGSDIDIVDPTAGSLPHLAVTGDAGGAWYPLDWSPDDRKLLVLKYVSRGEGYLYVVDLASGAKREVDPAPGKVGIGAARFSRDGQGVYYVSDRDGEFAKLRYINVFTAEKKIISQHVAGDVEAFALSRDGRYLAFVGNEAGIDALNLLDLRVGQDLTPPRLPAPGLIDHLRFDAESKRLAFAYASANQPRDAYVFDFGANRLERWTQSEIGAMDPAKIVTPRLVQIPTFDRVDGRTRELPAYVYQPAGPGPHPVLLMFPEESGGQFRPEFDPWIQYLINELGYAVITPNVRGSSGYGKSYFALDKGMQRDDVVKDLGALIVWVDSQSAFDPKHVVVAGGYLALAALVNYSDRLRGGIDIAGISDFVSFLTDTAPSLQTMARAEYGDERNPDMRAYLRRLSPLTGADRLQRPLLVVHGKRDREVPISESEQLVNRLRGRGAEVWYLQATDEGHTFRKKQNRDAYYRTFAQFLKSLQ